ncbi:MAG TPA: DUF1761 family protein [Candidatus Acidoferrales bacterium]|nr:DUF1761 family protein [Candidatus Acidoferrales bacterium]
MTFLAYPVPAVSGSLALVAFSTGRIALAIVLSAFVASFTDWFFGGTLFHSKYMAYPEIWRQKPGDRAAENAAVAWAMILGLLTSAAFVCACLAFAISGYAHALEFAALIWLAVPLPLLITNALFIKMHPLTVVAHSLGWLARLVISGAAVGWLLS